MMLFSFFANRTVWWKLLLTLFLILILGRFMIVGLAKVLFNTQSSDGDESAYLALALNLREEGVLTDGTRPPFYPLLLAPVADRDWSYFTWAKLITLSLGALTVLITFILGQRLFNWETGLLAAFLLAMNKEFHLRASTIYADTLLVLLFVLTWYFLIKSFEARRYGYLAGFFVGLAYLTKSSATLLLVAWGLTALVHYHRRLLAQKQLLIVPLMFLLTSSPLLIYNWQNFGSPFYNFATTHVMWMDRWAESQVEDRADLPTLATYFQTHTLADIFDRLRVGLGRLNPELKTTLIPSRTLEPAWLGPVGLASLLLLGGGLLLYRRVWLKACYLRHQQMIRMFLFLFIPFYLFSAWYARVLIESRFLIPILGPFYLLLSAAVIGCLAYLRHWLLSGEAPQAGNTLSSTLIFDRMKPLFGGRRPALSSSNGSAARPELVEWVGGLFYYAAVSIVLIWSSGWLVSTSQVDSWSLSVDPFASDREANTAPEAILSWLAHDHPAEMGQARVVFGPSKSLPLWKFPRRFVFERVPVEVDTWQAFQEYVDRLKPHYIIIDSDTARRRRQALGSYFTFSEEGVEFQRIPPGWMLVYLHADAPHPWSIFRPERPPSRPMFVKVGDQIELLGYDLLPSLETGERIIQVTLYWRTLTTPKKDYTLFLHLTAPDGFVKAQQDQQPFNGRWPTGRWVAGDLFADRYSISLDDWIEPGEYLLLAGLYEPQSGERLSLINAPLAPTPNAILLDKVKVE